MQRILLQAVIVRLFVALFVASGLWAQDTSAGSTDWKNRWDNYLDQTYNWKLVGAVAAESMFEQSFQLRKCGRPPYCFPHHVGGSLARRTARTTIELGAGALFKEDIQRRPSGLPHFRQRVVFALTHAALARGSEGTWRPAYSRYVGTLGAITVSSAWQGRPLTTGNLATSFALCTTNYFQDALFSEFEPDIRHFGRTVWHNLRSTFQ